MDPKTSLGQIPLINLMKNEPKIHELWCCSCMGIAGVFG